MFAVLGSASPDLTGLSSESLAGRVSFVELAGFRLDDIGADRLDGPARLAESFRKLSALLSATAILVHKVSAMCALLLA